MKQNPIEAICSPIPLGKSELCLCVILTLDFHILGMEEDQLGVQTVA